MPSQAGVHSKTIRREGEWRVNGPKHHEELLHQAIAAAHAAADNQDTAENGIIRLHFPDGSILGYKLDSRGWMVTFCMVLESAAPMAKQKELEPRYHIWAGVGGW